MDKNKRKKKTKSDFYFKNVHFNFHTFFFTNKKLNAYKSIQHLICRMFHHDTFYKSRVFDFYFFF